MDETTQHDADRVDLAASARRPERFRGVFERNVGAIHRYLARRVGVRLADDLVGETFLVAFERRAGFDPSRGTARAWLFGIATNLVRRHHRSEGRRATAYARVGTHAARLDGAGFDERVLDLVRVDEALAVMDPDLRDVVVLVAVADLTYDEVAAALGIPIGTVRSRLSRGRRRLRAALDLDDRPDRPLEVES